MSRIINISNVSLIRILILLCIIIIIILISHTVTFSSFFHTCQVNSHVCKVHSYVSKNKEWILKVHNIWGWGESFGEGTGCEDFRRPDDGGGGTWHKKG
jgi:sensor domain CHASE-containing protein